MAEPSPGGTQAIDRAASLVTTVVEADAPLSFADLQDASGLAKSTTSRLLTALERGGLLERESDGGYVAGRLFWVYATRHDPWEELVRLARPVMRRLGEQTQESVHLSVVRGDRVTQVAQVDSQYLLGTRDWSEVDVPPHCSALGKVFYAFGGLEVPDEAQERRTASTLAGPAELRRDAELARRRGWAATVDELEVGLSGVAVPVYGAHGELIAGLGLSGPTQRMEARLEILARHLDDHAAQLSRLLRGRRDTHKEGVA